MDRPNASQPTTLLESLEPRLLLANSPFPTTVFAGSRVIQEVVQGDFDADGRADIVFTRARELTFLRNLGDGEYAAPRTIKLNADIGKLAKGRLNGDTAPDLASVVRLANGNTLVRALFFDRGVGMFVTGPRLVLSGGFTNVKAIDLTSDVRSEILIENGSTIRLLSLPDRTRIVDRGIVFTAPAEWTNHRIPNDRFLTAIGDLDSNGRSELIIAHRNYDTPASASFILERNNLGNGVDLREGMVIPGHSIVITDLNGDSVKDLAWTDTERQLVVAMGTGGGQFAAGVAVRQFNVPDPGIWQHRALEIRGFGDLDRDGKIDLFVEHRYYEDYRNGSFDLADAYGVLQTDSDHWNRVYLDGSSKPSSGSSFVRNPLLDSWTLTYATQDSAADLLSVRINTTPSPGAIQLFANRTGAIAPITVTSARLLSSAGNILPLPSPGSPPLAVRVFFDWMNDDSSFFGVRSVAALRIHRDMNNNGRLDSADLLIAQKEYADTPFNQRPVGSDYFDTTVTDAWGAPGTFRLIGELVYNNGTGGTSSATLLLEPTFALTV